MSRELISASVLSPSMGLTSYAQAISGIPILSADEERRLAEDLYYREDLEAARQLVLSHLRFVMHIARSYNGYGLPQADLVQEGNIGLMKAVKRFNPEKGVRLISFAVHWIKAEIHEYILRNWRIVKIATTKPQRKLFFNLRGAKKVWRGCPMMKRTPWLKTWVCRSTMCARWRVVCPVMMRHLMSVWMTTKTKPTPCQQIISKWRIAILLCS